MLLRMPLRAGDRAPSFSKTAHNGETITVPAQGERERCVVLYFYPADETPGCTVEACSFRDSFEMFAQAGAEVVGVSGDSLDRHRAFAEHHRLPFPLLADEDGSLRRSFGVTKTLGLLPGRVTFVIDRGCTIRHVFSSQLRVKRHIEEALELVKQLR